MMKNAQTLDLDKLKPADKFMMIEYLIKSLDQPDEKISETWLKEAEARLKAYREGKLKTVTMEQFFTDRLIQK